MCPALSTRRYTLLPLRGVSVHVQPWRTADFIASQTVPNRGSLSLQSAMRVSDLRTQAMGQGPHPLPGSRSSPAFLSPSRQRSCPAHIDIGCRREPSRSFSLVSRTCRRPQESWRLQPAALGQVSTSASVRGSDAVMGARLEDLAVGQDFVGQLVAHFRLQHRWQLKEDSVLLKLCSMSAIRNALVARKSAWQAAHNKQAGCLAARKKSASDCTDRCTSGP